MFNNILVILSNGPLEDNRDANEFQILAQLFKSKDKPSVRNAKTVFLYDVDPTLLGKSDAVFQDFRSRVAYVYPDRWRTVQKITFEKYFFERKGI